MAFPNSDGTACPDTVIWLDRWNEASADSSSVLFLDCPPVAPVSSGPRFSLLLQDYVSAYSSVFLPPVDPWPRFIFLASFRTIIRKAGQSFAPCDDTSPGQLARASYRDFRSITTGTQLLRRRRRQGLVIRRYILGMEVRIHKSKRRRNPFPSRFRDGKKPLLLGVFFQ